MAMFKKTTKVFAIQKSRTGHLYLCYLILAAILLFSTACNQEKKSNLIRDGNLDLSQLGCLDHTAIRLDGRWNFYWQKLYTLQDIRKMKSEIDSPRLKDNSNTRMMPVPGLWKQKGLRGDGFGTYHLHVSLPAIPRRPLAIKFRQINTAYRLFINDKEILTLGKVGKNEQSMAADAGGQLALFQPANKDFDLILQVSDFKRHNGGILDFPLLLDSARLNDYQNRQRMIELFLVGAFTIISLYHFGLFSLHRRERSLLYLALLSFAMTIYTLTTGDRIIKIILPNLDFEILFKMTFLSYYMATQLSASFVRSIFREDFPAIVEKVILLTITIASLIVLLLPSKYSIFTAQIIRIVTLVFGAFVTYVIIQATVKKRPGAKIYLAGFIIFFLFTINDILHINHIIITEEIAPIGFLAFVLAHAYLLAVLQSQNIRTVEDLSINLDQKVMQRTQELESAMAQLRKLSAEKTDFFANISHELRTPLTMLMSPLESIRKGNLGPAIPYDHKIFNIMERNAKSLLQQINNLLSYARFDQDRDTIELKTLSISLLLKRICAEFESTVQLHKIKFTYENIEPAVFIQGNPELLEQTIVNIFFKLFQVLEQDDRIDVHMFAENEKVRILISGERTNPNLSDSNNNLAADGSEIIISIAGEILAIHEGKLNQNKTEQDPRQFNYGIILPLHSQTSILYTETSIGGKEDLKSIPAPSSINKDKQREDLSQDSNVVVGEKSKTENNSFTKSHTILIVEDNFDLQDLLLSILEPEYNVLQALNGKEALDKLDIYDSRIDLIISDIMMPQMDGYTLLEKLRNIEKFKNLPILFLTARADERMKIESLENGAQDYIIKPFNTRELLARIRVHLKLKDLLEESKKSSSDNEQSNQNKEKSTDSENGKEATEINQVKIKIIEDYLRQNFTDNVSREGLAAMINMSPDHFGKIFTRVTGKRVTEYINLLRIEKACHLLANSDMKIVDISFQVGFESLRTFNRVFANTLNLSPKEYRDNPIPLQMR